MLMMILDLLEGRKGDSVSNRVYQVSPKDSSWENQIGTKESRPEKVFWEVPYTFFPDHIRKRKREEEIKWLAYTFATAKPA